MAAMGISARSSSAARATALGRLLPAAFEAASVRYRRILLVPEPSSEGLPTEPTAAAHPRRRELVSCPAPDVRSCYKLSQREDRKGTFSLSADDPPVWGFDSSRQNAIVSGACVATRLGLMA